MSKYWFKFGVFYWNSSFAAGCDDFAVIHCIFVLTSKPLPRSPPKKNKHPKQKKQKTYWVLGCFGYIYRPEFWNFWSLFFGSTVVVPFFLFLCPCRRLGGKSPFTFDADGSVTTTLWLGIYRYIGEMFGQRLSDSYICSRFRVPPPTPLPWSWS